MKFKIYSMALCMLFFSFSAFAQSKSVSGKVTDAVDGSPLPGVTVVVDGTTNGTVTNVDGMYTLNAEPGQTLVFSFIGYKSSRVPVGSANSYNVGMEAGVELDEVVVTALGITRDRRAIGYSAQTVGGDNVLKANETNLISALSAKASGVQVNKSSGAAGASSFILIRGQNTIRGDNQPLLVIDGIPIDNSQVSSGNPNDGRNGFLSSVANSNRGIDIPQEDIEDITVLKGAAATALYGSQAGNGAILITTKKGKMGYGKKGINVNVTAGVEVSEYNRMIPLQNQWGQGLFGSYSGPETGSGFSWGPRLDTMEYATDMNHPLAPSPDNFDANGNYIHDQNGFLVPQGQGNGQPANAYNNIDDFFQNAVRQWYNVDLSGANEKTNYFVSMGYSDENGIVPNNTFSKWNIGFNGGHKFTDKFTVSSSIKYINSGGSRIEQGSNTSGVMLGLTRTSPTFDNSNGLGEDAADDESAYVFPDGTQRKYRYGNTGYDNPFWTVNRNPLEDDVNRIIGKLEFDYKFSDAISAKYRVGLDNYSDYRNQFFAIGSRTATAGRVTENNILSNQFNEDLMLFINKDISENIGLNVTLGHNRRSDELTRVYIQGDGLTIPNFYDLSNASALQTINVDQLERNQALYGMAEVSFNDYLYLTLTGRNEWSTSLPTDNNSFFYPSAGIGFVFSDALDLSNKTFTFGKLRFTYAKVGLGSPFLYATDNYFTSAFHQDGWTNGLTFPFNGVSSFEQSATLGDANLEPEDNTELELGLDLRFLNNRLGIDFTYYNKESNGLIFPVPLAATSGYDFLITNAGSMTNNGIEITAFGNPVRTKTGFNWDINVNFTRNVNEVTQLANGVDNVLLGGFTGANIRAEVGQPYGSIFGFGFYRDASGAVVIGDDGFPVLDPEERSFGNAQPDWTMGISNGFSYKGFTLSALVDIRQGGEMWNGTKGALYFWGTHGDTDVRGTSKVFEGNLATYDGAGNIVLDGNGVPVTSGSNSQSVVLDEGWLALGNGNGFFGDNTEDFVEDISWVRLREVSLNYNLPTKMIEKTPFTGINIGISGRNLALSTDYTGIDPETSLSGSRNEQGMDYFNMPNTKGYTFTVRLSL
ncbi:MAG: SusC/RagA family TonB-linked outer membrane protein [Bacteroidota bacterium]